MLIYIVTHIKQQVQELRHFNSFIYLKYHWLCEMKFCPIGSSSFCIVTSCPTGIEGFLTWRGLKGLDSDGKQTYFEIPGSDISWDKERGMDIKMMTYVRAKLVFSEVTKDVSGIKT